MTHSPSTGRRRRVALAFAAGMLLLVNLAPTAMAVEGATQRYIVVLDGEYALTGEYALGSGYALVGQESSYALGSTYALGRNYALYALSDTYALVNSYALTATYALDGTYALFGQYALNSGYALGANYALGSGYALASSTGSYALDSSYALTSGMSGYALNSGYALLDAYALGSNYALARDYALAIVSQAGGTVTADLTRQAGLMMVESKNTAFAQTMAGYALVEEVGLDIGWQAFPSMAQAVASGQLSVVSSSAVSTSGPDPLESQQWSMAQIHAPQAHDRQMGRPEVQVGIIDSGVDGNHQDFFLDGVSNVDCQRGADFTANGPGIGIPSACVDNNFHGTHVAGIIGARKNGIGVVGVAPNVTMIPIKVCDADGHCYVSDAVEGITYAGDLGLDVINMSFYVDDDEFQGSTEFKCASDPTQRAYREAVARAITYARTRGVTMIAALGNSDTDLAHPPGGADCKVVPVQLPGVTGIAALGNGSEKAAYSNWGKKWADVAAPGGNGGTADCGTTVISTIPGSLYGCFQGTSMASPHATGVAALIISQFGKFDAHGNFGMKANKVAKKLFKTSIDIGQTRYDECFGYGRIDALRAVYNVKTRTYDAAAPFCPEYNE